MLSRTQNNGSIEISLNTQKVKYAARIITEPWAMKIICMEPNIRLSPMAPTPYMHPNRIPLMTICKKTGNEEKKVTSL
jgi:hypothetical protein